MAAVFWIAGGAAALLLLSSRKARAFSTSRSGAVDVALDELALWDGLKETDDQGAAHVNRYWATQGVGPQDPDHPWSAAFISHVTAKGDPGALVSYPGHISYTRAAYRNLGVPGRYGAYRPSDVVIQPGDIIVKGRAGEPVGWSDVVSSTGHKLTHGDIVERVSADTARAIGGNLNNSVSFTNYPLKNGQIDSSTAKGALVFAILKKNP